MNQVNMQTIQIIQLIASVLVPVLIVAISILWNSNNRVSEKALELERLLRERDEENKEAIAKIDKRLSEAVGAAQLADSKIKNHIYNCANFKPRLREHDV